MQIAAALAVLIALIGGLWIAIREGREAERQRIVAQRHFDSVRKLANRLFDFHDEVARLPQLDRGARDARQETSLEYLDALNKEANTDRVLQEELGVAYRRVGDIQGNPYEGNIGDFAGRVGELRQIDRPARAFVRSPPWRSSPRRGAGPIVRATGPDALLYEGRRDRPVCAAALRQPAEQPSSTPTSPLQLEVRRQQSWAAIAGSHVPALARL